MLTERFYQSDISNFENVEKKKNNQHKIKYSKNLGFFPHFQETGIPICERTLSGVCVYKISSRYLEK